MADVQVTCTTKEGGSGHEHITHVGGPGAGTRWWWTTEAVIQSIEAKTNTFFTRVNGVRAEIGVVTPERGRRYLRTYADGRWSDNLLALPACPR